MARQTTKDWTRRDGSFPGIAHLPGQRPQVNEGARLPQRLVGPSGRLPDSACHFSVLPFSISAKVLSLRSALLIWWLAIRVASSRFPTDASFRAQLRVWAVSCASDGRVIWHPPPRPYQFDSLTGSGRPIKE